MSWGASTIKLKNRLAQLSETVESESQYALSQSQLRLKMKSVNQLARSDADFMPHSPSKPHPFEHCLAQTEYVNVYQSRKSPNKWQVMNPEQDATALAESRVRKVQSEILPEVEAEFDTMSVFRCRSEIQTRKYCYDCDEGIDRLSKHKCRRLSTLSIIDHRLRQLEASAGERFVVLVETGRRAKTSAEVRSLIGTLKSIKGQQLEE